MHTRRHTCVCETNMFRFVIEHFTQMCQEFLSHRHVQLTDVSESSKTLSPSCQSMHDSVSMCRTDSTIDHRWGLGVESPHCFLFTVWFVCVFGCFRHYSFLWSKLLIEFNSFFNPCMHVPVSEICLFIFLLNWGVKHSPQLKDRRTLSLVHFSD